MEKRNFENWKRKWFRAQPQHDVIEEWSSMKKVINLSLDKELRLDKSCQGRTGTTVEKMLDKLEERKKRGKIEEKKFLLQVS